jgi:triacylglycerol lipase
MLPVLCVHGIDDTGSKFNRLRCALSQRGFKTVEAMDIQPPDGSISFEKMAVQIQMAASQLLVKSQAEKIDLVGYSMGALASRYFIQQLGGKSIVRNFISLAGPHNGTWMAYLRPGIGCRQMRPGSAILRQLDADPDPWGQVKVASFWTPLDLSVLPASSACLPQAENRRFWVGLHPLMVVDRRVIQAVIQVLSS